MLSVIYAECHYAECRDYLNVMLSVVMPSVVMPSVVMLNVVMLSVVAPSIRLAPALMTRLGRQCLPQSNTLAYYRYI